MCYVWMHNEWKLCSTGNKQQHSNKLIRKGHKMRQDKPTVAPETKTEHAWMTSPFKRNRASTTHEAWCGILNPNGLIPVTTVVRNAIALIGKIVIVAVAHPERCNVGLLRARVINVTETIYGVNVCWATLMKYLRVILKQALTGDDNYKFATKDLKGGLTEVNNRVYSIFQLESQASKLNLALEYMLSYTIFLVRTRHPYIYFLYLGCGQSAATFG